MSLFTKFPTVHSLIHAFLTIFYLCSCQICVLWAELCEDSTLFHFAFSPLHSQSISTLHVIYNYTVCGILKQIVPLTSQRFHRKFFCLYFLRSVQFKHVLLIGSKKLKQPQTFLNLLHKDAELSQTFILHWHITMKCGGNSVLSMQVEDDSSFVFLLRKPLTLLFWNPPDTCHIWGN